MTTRDDKGSGGRWSAVGTLSLLTFIMVIASRFIRLFCTTRKRKGQPRVIRKQEKMSESRRNKRGM